MKKTLMKAILPVALALALMFSCVITAGAESYKLGDSDLSGEVEIVDATTIQRYLVSMITLSDTALKASDVDKDSDVTILDTTFIQRFLINIKAPAGIDETVFDYGYTYSLNADLLKGTPGVYEVKAVVGDKMDGDSPKTIGIPSIAKQNLKDGPTTEAPAIIMGAANGFETKTGPVEWTMNDGLSEDDITAPYSYFRHRVIDEKITDADGKRPDIGLWMVPIPVSPRTSTIPRCLMST